MLDNERTWLYTRR